MRGSGADGRQDRLAGHNELNQQELGLGQDFRRTDDGNVGLSQSRECTRLGLLVL